MSEKTPKSSTPSGSGKTEKTYDADKVFSKTSVNKYDTYQLKAAIDEEIIEVRTRV